MDVVGSIFIFVVVWWVVFFAVLPWGVRSQLEAGERLQGTDPGAPVTPRLGRKALITTLIAAVIWAIILALVWTLGPALWDFYGQIVPEAPVSRASS